jgi:hypothetical protein
MNTSTRKKIGAAVVVISLLVAVALYVSGTPLLSLQDSRTTSSPDGSAVMTVAIYKRHWSLGPICVFALVGLVAFLWPAPKPPRLQS